MTGARTLRLHRLTWEAPGVLALDLTDPDGGVLPAFTPGAHIDLHLPDGPVRQYSLCGNPAARDVWRIAVREVGGGRASGFIHRTLRPGALLRAEGPRNNFPLLPATDYLFVAGGIGITPILPMLRAAAEAGARRTLLFCARTTAEAPLLAEARAFGGDVRVHAAAEGTRLDVAAQLAMPRPDTLLYCCGPARLMLAVEDATHAWPAGSVRFEWFAPRPQDDAGAAGGFEVVCARAGLACTVPEGQSVLDTLLAAGLDVPFSCTQGVCGTCETRVLEGPVDHRDSILSAAERAANASMMICVSRAQAARLVLDL